MGCLQYGKIGNNFQLSFGSLSYLPNACTVFSFSCQNWGTKWLGNLLWEAKFLLLNGHVDVCYIWLCYCEVKANEQSLVMKIQFIYLVYSILKKLVKDESKRLTAEFSVVFFIVALSNVRFGPKMLLWHVVLPAAIPSESYLLTEMTLLLVVIFLTNPFM